MRKTISILFLFLFCLTTTAMAENQKRLGGGLFIGSPTSLVGKYWTRQNRAYQFGLAFAFDDYVLVHTDYLMHFTGTFKTTEAFINSLVPYVGVGGIVVITTEDRKRKNDYLGKDSGSLGLGLRIPVGVEWRNADPSIGVYLELVPGISIAPETSSLFMGGIGARFYF